MDFKEVNTIEKILNGLFKVYESRVPDVLRITSSMITEGIINDADEIVNDHIAFRTLGLPNLGIQSFEKVFLHYGYVKKDYYFFESKKLDAYWYSPPNSNYPRVFISELRVKELTKVAQEVIGKYTSKIKTDPVDLIDLDNFEEVLSFFEKPLWELPVLNDYLILLKESEYASWVLYNRYYLNHYTLSVHALKGGYNTLKEFNQFLMKIKIELNDSGGVIKESKDGLLLQSSSVANTFIAEFANNEMYPISGSYVEFAERKILPQFLNRKASDIEVCHRRDGFEAANADKIFESTYLIQTKKE